MVKTENSSYESKLDQIMAQSMQTWWESLSKEELLTYMMEQPQITADFIRQMMANENCVMGIGVKFSMNAKDAKANLHVDQH